MTKRIHLTEKKIISTLKGKRLFRLFSLTTMLMLVALLTWQCKKDDFTGESFGVCPEVMVTNPANGALNVITNKLIKATFNKKMNASTINSTTFLVRQGINLVSGSVSYSESDSTATFTPKNLLAANTVYTATITREVKDPRGNIPIADSTWTFNTGSTPIVSVTDPHNGDVDISINKLITIDFSTTMDPTTINGSTFFVKKGNVSVVGGVSYVKQEASAIVVGKVIAAGLRATFTPTGGLEPNKVYSVTISKNVKDVAGNAMAKDTTFSFSTGVLPSVVANDPQNGAIDVAVNKKINATFSKSMDNTTINTTTFILKHGTTAVFGTVTYSGVNATFSPTSNLLPNTQYTATILVGTKDVSGNSIANNYIWSFTTGLSSNLILPTIVSTDPLNLATDVNLNQIIRASFSETMNQATINALTFTVKNGINPVSGVVSYSGVTAVFTPSVNLLPNTTYSAKISTVAKNVAGNAMAVDFGWTFTTGTTVPAGPVGVNLASSANFAILAGSGISNTGTTTRINGDVGSFATSTINGLLPLNVNGTLYIVADPVVGTAIFDLTTAYIDAQSRSLNAISLPGQLGGLTLAPGLYVNSSTSGISGTGANGILTLDAGGDTNAVWIFKMGSTFITNAGTSIVLAGGAKAKNIYWSVGTSATLGTNSIFYGNILADQSITMTTGATLTGRALTRIGAVTLDSNTITKP